MLLASVNDIVAALGFDQMTDIQNAASMALDAAEAQLMAALDTDFEAGTFSDIFFVDEAPARGSVEFRLSHGLVSSLTQVLANADPGGFDTDPVSTWSSGGWPLRGYVAGQNVDCTANCTPQLDQKAKDRGVIRDILSRYRQTYVRVTYVAGFAADGTNPASYDLTQVPDWLQQAAKLNAMIGLADSPALSEASVKLDVKSLTNQYNALLGRKVRYAPLAVLPL